MLLQVIITPGEDGMLIAECPAIPGCMSQGRDEQELLLNIKDAIQCCLEVRRDLGLPPTVDVKELRIEVAA